MQLIAPIQTLFAAVQQPVSVVDKKNTIPVLSNVLLQASENLLKIVATNLEVGMQTSCIAEVQQPGNITVPAQKFLEILKESPDGVSLKIETDEKHWVHLSYVRPGKSAGGFKIAGLPDSDFPNLPKIDATQQFEIGAEHLAFCLAKTLPCVSHDESRYALTGLLCEVKGDVLAFVGTDGHRLSRAVTRLPKDTGIEQTVILPAKAAMEIRKMKGAAVSLGFSENQLMASTEQTMLVSRLIEAQYPDYKQILPQSAPITVKANIAEWNAVLRRVALMSSDTRMIECHFNGNEATLTTKNNEGDARESFAIEKEGADISIGMNARYLMDALQQANEAETITMQMSDELSPAAFFTENKDEWLSIIMPMRRS